MTARVLLVGGGHAHVGVLRAFARQRPKDVAVTLASPLPHAVYSGMVPGLVAGHYALDAVRIDLRALCDAAGAQFVALAAVGLEPDAAAVRLQGGARLDADVMSIDTGASPPLAPGVRADGALPHLSVKPIEPFLSRWRALRVAAVATTQHIVVVGGGAGGVELACAMHWRGRAEHLRLAVTLVTGASGLLAGHAAPVRARVLRHLHAKRITVVDGVGVAAVRERRVALTDATTLDADAMVWATGAGAPDWLAGSRLARDARGFVAIDPRLRSVSHPHVFAAGDVATHAPAPWPKSGVYAVRQGPVLAENLLRFVRAQPLLPFRAQARALALIATGPRHAIASWGAWSAEGAWVWRGKDWIDRRFVRG
ncbi:MAG: FAD-dependent oxidoreductase, partial [Burkholderiales bacterium]|nr:FAD-dependent oxidoreductase [Burkholderiales bacterium]